MPTPKTSPNLKLYKLLAILNISFQKPMTDPWDWHIKPSNLPLEKVKKPNVALPETEIALENR